MLPIAKNNDDFIAVQRSETMLFNAEYMLEMFLLYVKGSASKATQKAYEKNIKHFLKWLDDNKIKQPKRADVLTYKEYLNTSGYKVSTQTQYLQAIIFFFKWANSEKLYDNIADNVKPPKVNAQAHKKDSLQRDAVSEIASSIDRTTEKGKRLYFIYLLMITGGLRCIELNRANAEDLQTIHGKTYLYIQGKGHSEKDAPILIIDEVLTAYNDYNSERIKNGIKVNGKTPLITATGNRNKGGRIATTTISTMIKELLIENGFDSSRLTAHSLRHTSGTGAYKATNNIYLAQKHQRHANPQTTEIYVHAEEREERETEKQVFEYYFKTDSEADTIKHGIARSLDGLTLEQLKAIQEIINNH